MTTMQPEKQRPPTIPLRAFALVFGLVNGALWFALAGAVLSGVTTALSATGRLGGGATLVSTTTVAFFACFFGMPGALGGYLGQAGAGRIALPPAERWGPGALRQIHRTSFFHGAVSAAAVAATGWWYLGDHPPPSRGDLVVVVALVAAAVAAVNSALLVGGGALGDLRRRGTPDAPTGRYYWRRFALPQGAGNGLVTALVAAGTFPGAGTPLTRDALVTDAVATTLVIGLFMLTTGGALATLDRRYRIVAAVAAAPPSWARRLRLLAGAVALSAGLAFVIGLGAGVTGLSLPLFVAWKGALGAAAAGGLATYAARATLAKPE